MNREKTKSETVRVVSLSQLYLAKSDKSINLWANYPFFYQHNGNVVYLREARE